MGTIYRNTPSARDRRGAGGTFKIALLASTAADSRHEQMMLTIVIRPRFVRRPVGLMNKPVVRFFKVGVRLAFQVRPDVAVGKTHVKRIDSVLHALQPVALRNTSDL